MRQRTRRRARGRGGLDLADDARGRDRALRACLAEDDREMRMLRRARRCAAPAGTSSRPATASTCSTASPGSSSAATTGARLRAGLGHPHARRWAASRSWRACASIGWPGGDHPHHGVRRRGHPRPRPRARRHAWCSTSRSTSTCCATPSGRCSRHDRADGLLGPPAWCRAGLRRAAIERVGPLTPYLTQTIVEDALRRRAGQPASSSSCRGPTVTICCGPCAARSTPSPAAASRSTSGPEGARGRPRPPRAPPRSPTRDGVSSLACRRYLSRLVRRWGLR